MKCEFYQFDIGRGLFFSHFGWLMINERDEVDEKRKTIDMSDCIADPFVMFQKKYYWTLMPLISIVLPTWILCHFFGETLSAAWHVGFVLRHLYTLHDTFLINSFAHHTGMKREFFDLLRNLFVLNEIGCYFLNSFYILVIFGTLICLHQHMTSK